MEGDGRALEDDRQQPREEGHHLELLDLLSGQSTYYHHKCTCTMYMYLWCIHVHVHMCRYGSSNATGLGELVHLESIPEQENDCTAVGKSPSLGLQSPASSLAHNLTLSLRMASPHVRASSSALALPHGSFGLARECGSAGEGLNSLLSSSPSTSSSLKERSKESEGTNSKVGIRRSALRQYYGRSVHSPNLRTEAIRRSPRLTGAYMIKSCTYTCTCT